MLNKLFQYAQKPQLYAPSSAKFWDDPHISQKMLECHINPQIEAASRNHAFIAKSVEWIQKIAPPQTHSRLLDLGCGPGMYTQRLVHKGYTVTGIDYSSRSIAYAKQQAQTEGSSIEYLYQNYLEIAYHDSFAVVIMIYCDYGVLSPGQRQILLQKVYDALQVGGKFVFDVFTPEQYQGKEESHSWHLQEGGGFWKPHTYLCLDSHFIYDDNTRLDQSIIIDQNNNIDVFRIWDHYYTTEMIAAELKAAGFTNVELYADVAGRPYFPQSKTIGIVAEK